MIKLSPKIINERLEALEVSRGASQRRQDEISLIDVTSHIAPVYHPLHEDIRHNEHEFYNLPGGRGSGKSSFVSLEIVNGIMQDLTGKSNALVVRKFAVTLRGSVFSQIQWAIDTLGVSSRWKSTVSPLQFTYETGQVIRLTGLDDPQKLKSMKPNKGYFRFLWMEEFSEINGEPEMRNLQQSVLRGGGHFTVFRSFNPPMSKSNWANNFISIPDSRAVTLLTDYRQIPVEWLGEQFFSEAERLKEINELAYRNEYLGEAVGSGGAVFPNVEVREIQKQEVEWAQYLFGGIDFGFAVDPSVFLLVSYDRKRDTIFLLDEIYQAKLGNAELAKRIRNIFDGLPNGGVTYSRSPLFNEVYKDDTVLIHADCADPRSISDLRDNGINAKACHKEAGCVEYRIRWLQRRKIVIDPARTPNAYREFTNYEYEQDKNGNFLSVCPDRDNHTIDALAYALDRDIYRRGVSA